MPTYIETIVETEIGKLNFIVTGDNHICVNELETHKVTVNNKPMKKLGMHFYRKEDKSLDIRTEQYGEFMWGSTSRLAVLSSVHLIRGDVYSEGTDTMKEKAYKVVFEAVNTWAPKNKGIFKEMESRLLDEAIEAKMKKITETKKELEVLEKELKVLLMEK